MSALNVKIIPPSEFIRVQAYPWQGFSELEVLADMCRINALSAVKRAGSGHLGSSFSAMDILARLYFRELNTLKMGFSNSNRDIYFSSKGHDVPALYSVLFALGVIPEEKFLRLRRMGGLEGHPDISTTGIEANSGSLGMGISKGRGMAWAKNRLKAQGRVFVMTGDGEMQEGQNWEALQCAVAGRDMGRFFVIVDHNKVQSDKYVRHIVDLGDLESKLKAFGWLVFRCNGHDQAALEEIFRAWDEDMGRPRILIADTIKGRGVSFMEHPGAMNQSSPGLYPWHAGAPNDADYQRALQEILDRINTKLENAGLKILKMKDVLPEPLPRAEYTLAGEPVSLAMPVTKVSKKTNEFIADAYGEALLGLAKQVSNLVVLDADLAADCRVRAFENAFPDRFIECGIAEQDMVSMAGGLARMGFLPVVNSFASFLASRANEQIYNNASEKTKIIYVFHYAGVIPAGPGKSHQSIRDISLVGALPNCEIIQPANAIETRMAIQYAVEQADVNVVLRLVIGPSPRVVVLPEDYRFEPGRGVILTKGKDVAVFAYGPVMLHETLLASEILTSRGICIRIINMPWLNRFDIRWLEKSIQDCSHIWVVEDHAPVGGLGDRLFEEFLNSGQLRNRKFHKTAVEGYPVFGTPQEALQYHCMDGVSLASQLLKVIVDYNGDNL
ncbi:MAG: 1-deoxy-D-xylulose-5-phosphate synthase [Deltaproteobacteria bacterium RBG_13_47_9]|nr:MAG: 1-deoxy-D-xylulose-5-phosphate synthase [Deltaproteobacteria bacterium RBG_13_47_9]